MIPTERAFLLSVLFSLVFLLESEGATSDKGRSDEPAPGEDALQGLSLLQQETRQEWKEALRLLEKRIQEEMQRRDAEVQASVEGLELRIRDIEKRVSALDQDKLECAGGRDEFDRLNGRLSRLEDCLQRAVDGCSPSGTPPTPASSPIPSSARFSTTSSTTSLSSHTSSSTYNATTNYTSTSAAISSTSSFASSNSIPTSTALPATSSNPSTNTAAFPTSTPGSSSNPAPPPSEASEPQHPAASTAPPTADPYLGWNLGERLNNAAREGNMQEVERLLVAGADPNYAKENGWTPLLAASQNGHAPVVSLLVRRGADVHAASPIGFTALHFAAYYEHSDRVVPLLVAAGARVDRRDMWGRTPLHNAALWNHEAAVRALLAAGASKTLKDDFGKIPRDQATGDAVRRLLRP